MSPLSHPGGCVKMVVRVRSSPVSVILGVGAGVADGVELDVVDVDLYTVLSQ